MGPSPQGNRAQIHFTRKGLALKGPNQRASTLQLGEALSKSALLARIAELPIFGALHLHLASRLPLVAVVHSGGKSLHGWYFVFGKTDGELRPFMNYAVGLGADHATWLRSQFVRLPDGRRENGRRQVTYHLDPGKAVRCE